MPRPRKVFTKSGFSGKNFLINASRKAASDRKKAERERERAAKKRERERIKATKERERAAKKRERERERDSKKRQRESERNRKKWVAEANRMSSTAEKKQKEVEKIELRARKKLESEANKKRKLILRLNGLFLEHEVLIQYSFINSFSKKVNIDLREIAYDYELENGLTTTTQFKKVTLPYLNKNLIRIVGKSIESYYVEDYKLLINRYFEQKVVPNNIKVVIESEIEEKQKQFINKFPKNTINLPEDTNSLTLLSKGLVKPTELIKKNALDVFNENEAQLSQSIKELISLAEQKIISEKKKAEAAEKQKKDKLLAKKGFNTLNKVLHESRIYIKEVNKEVKGIKSELDDLSAAYQKAFLKGKYRKSGLQIFQNIWKRTFKLLNETYKIEQVLLNIKKQENTKLGKIITVVSQEMSEELSNLELEFRKNYKILIDCTKQRFMNLKEASKYIDDEKRDQALAKINQEIKTRFLISKNIMNLKEKFLE